VGSAAVRTGDVGPMPWSPPCRSCPSWTRGRLLALALLALLALLAALAVSLARGLTWVDRDCLAVADLDPAREHLAVGLEPQSARRHANPGFCAVLVHIEVGLDVADALNGALDVLWCPAEAELEKENAHARRLAWFAAIVHDEWLAPAASTRSTAARDLRLNVIIVVRTSTSHT